MAKLKSINAQHFRIPLDVPASDFDARRDDVVRARSRSASPTPTGRRASATPTRPATTAAPSIICWPGDPRGRRRRRLRADRGGRGRRSGGRCIMAAAAARRARPLGARHGAVGPQGAAGEPAALSAAGRPRRAVPCYAGGIDLDLSVKDLLAQTDGNLAKGFRAIKTKVGRDKLQEDVERIRAMRKHLGDDFPLMVDANMKWSADEAIRRRAGAARVRPGVARGADHSRRRRGPRPGAARRRAAGRDRRELPHAVGVPADDLGRRRELSRAGRHQLRRRHRLHEGRAPRRGVQSARHLARRA